MTSERPLVLCFSRDQRLLETRSEVLALRYAVLPISTLQQLKTVDPQSEVDVVVLCHSLSEVECAGAAHVAHQRWPKAHIMTLSSPVSECQSAESEVMVSATEGPAALLRTVACLVQTSAAA